MSSKGSRVSMIKRKSRRYSGDMNSPFTYVFVYCMNLTYLMN